MLTRISTASVLSILIVCLAGLVAIELLAGVGLPPATDAAAGTSTISPPVSEVPTASAAASAASLDKLASTILSRPLFAPDRRPSGSKSDDTDPQPFVRPPATLVGTIISDEESAAVLEIGDHQVTRFLGDKVGNGKILQITLRSILVLDDDGQLRELPLTAAKGVLPPPQLEPSTRAFHLEK